MERYCTRNTFIERDYLIEAAKQDEKFKGWLWQEFKVMASAL